MGQPGRIRYAESVGPHVNFVAPVPVQGGWSCWHPIGDGEDCYCGLAGDDRPPFIYVICCPGGPVQRVFRTGLTRCPFCGYSLRWVGHDELLPSELDEQADLHRRFLEENPDAVYVRPPRPSDP